MPKNRWKARAIVRLIRVDLTMAAGICVLLGEILALGGLPTARESILGFLAGFLVSASANISNDYFDFEVDKVNNPERPLPSGDVKPIIAKILTIFFSIAGLASAAFLGIVPLVMGAAVWMVSMLYNWRFKELGVLGNLMVSSCVAMTFIFGGAIVGQLNGVILVFGMLAFIFDLAEEIAGGAMDLEGDKRRSVRTLARRKGKEAALQVTLMLLIIFVALTFLPLILGWLWTPYLILILPTNLVILYFAFKLRFSRSPEEGRAKMRQLYLTLAIFIVAFIVSRFI